MPQIANIFYKGEDTDTDVTLIQSDKARAMHNMRLIDVDGKGLVAINIAGTELKFNLTSGFIPVGSTSFNGVLYIASTNLSTGEGELGCYPAPNSILQNNGTISGFGPIKQYAPLRNYTGLSNANDPNSVNSSFRTNSFRFDCKFQVQIQPREDYDGSINLYIAQNNISLKVYNTGFHNNTGVWTSKGRRYWEGSFPNAVNVIQESAIHANIQFLGLGNNGKTKAGNWFLFFRYSTENFDKTSFFNETNAIQITSGLYSINGIRHHGDEGSEVTDKSIKVRLIGLDPTYPFIEVGYMRAFNDVFEFGFIDKLFKVDPSLSNLDIEITGNEGQFNIDISEFLRIKTRYDGAKTIAQLENRFWAGNIFDSTEYDSEKAKELALFASKITCVYDDSKLLQHSTGSSYVGIYNNEFNVYNNTGYFRGEAYPYGVVFVLDNGRETESFPIQGVDNYTGVPTATNQNGVYRFPNIQVSPLTAGNDVRVMGIKFNITAALFNIPQFIQDKIVGFYFTRGERNKNLVYQGVTLPCYTAANGEDIRNGFFYLILDRPEILKQNENWTPMLEVSQDVAFYPYKARFDDSVILNNEFNFVFQSSKLAKKKEFKFGLYSPDHLFNKSLTQGKHYIVENGKVDYGFDILDEQSKQDYFYYQTSIVYQPGINVYLDTYNIKEWEKSNNNGYTSAFSEGTNSDFNSMIYYYSTNFVGGKYGEISNLESAFGTYIGINSNWDLRYRFINTYSSNPDRNSGYKIEDLYDVKSTKYSKISQFYKLVDVIADPTIINNVPMYKGDAFLQRTFIKQMFNPRYPFGVKDDGGGISGLLAYIQALFSGFVAAKRSFSFGVVFEMITENTVNTEMRLENIVEKFYPGSAADVYDIAVKNIQRENVNLNRGYNQVLSVKTYQGYDKDVPFAPARRSTAVMFSNLHIVGSFEDGYRLIDLAAVKEYDLRLGQVNFIADLDGNLILIQDDSISRLFVNEKALLQGGDSTGELVIGNGDILSSKQQIIHDTIGSQHQWSIIISDNAIYGFDYSRRKFWMLSGQGFDIITDTKMYRKRSDQLVSRYNGDDSDITNVMPDNPICTAGIAGGYDRRFGDIVWTFVYGNPTDIGDCCSFNYDCEVVTFNELIQAFTGTRSHHTPLYLQNNEDFFSFSPKIFPSTMPPGIPLSVDGDCWIHDSDLGNTNYTKFYGVPDPYEAFMQFVVNEGSDFAKVFDNLDINSSGHELVRAEFITDQQEMTHFPWIINDSSSRWRNPLYQENLWRMPIIRSDAIILGPNNANNLQSRIRDKYVLIKLVWKQEQRVYLKTVLTNFRISKQ